MSESIDMMNARYLSIIDKRVKSLPETEALHTTWTNYLNDCFWDTKAAVKRLSEEYHGTYVSSGIVFRTEEDKVWFLLRWA